MGAAGAQAIMNGVHDMGGMHGMGSIVREKNEPVFHHEWERRTFAMNLAAGFLGKWNIDIARYTREQMPPPEYLAATYYERFLYGLQRLLLENGLITQEEIEGSQRPTPVSDTGLRVLRAETLAKIVKTGRMARVAENIAPRFRLGDSVITRNIHPLGHTRLPRYARGRRGTIAIDHGVFSFPDTNALGLGRKPQHVYSVRFAARELWGPDASPVDAIHIDLWDDYLDAV